MPEVPSPATNPSSKSTLSIPSSKIILHSASRPLTQFAIFLKRSPGCLSIPPHLLTLEDEDTPDRYQEACLEPFAEDLEPQDNPTVEFGVKPTDDEDLTISIAPTTPEDHAIDSAPADLSNFCDFAIKSAAWANHSMRGADPTPFEGVTFNPTISESTCGIFEVFFKPFEDPPMSVCSSRSR